MSSPCHVSPFHWNAGAWFGGQIGGTVWLLLGSITMVGQSPVVGLVWLGAFAMGNGLGLALWVRRKRLGNYTAIQILLLGLAALSVTSIAVADWGGQLLGQRGNLRAQAYCAMLVFPALMVRFWLVERFSSRISGGSATDPPPR